MILHNGLGGVIHSADVTEDTRGHRVFQLLGRLAMLGMAPSRGARLLAKVAALL
jgi:hypothetical protein